MTALPTGAVTFLFTDIEGSTRLWEEQHTVMEHAVARHDELLREAILAQSGYVFSTGGDAFSAAFSDPSEAIGTALEAQRALGSEPWNGYPLRVRMGVHSGIAHEREGDYFGPTLNRAARIMSAGHGGQILLSQATCELVSGRLPDGASLKALGTFRLKDLGQPEAISQLLHPDLADGFPHLRTLDTHLNNLPVELSSFVGRKDELEDTLDRLKSHRLVTLTGVGGSGKTRLAFQAAAEALDGFPDGVWVAELAALVDAESLDHWVLQEMGIDQSNKPPMERLTEFFAQRTCLLVLDNCEHLITAAARFADSLLKASPGLKILATSREGLGVRGEQLIQVPSLTVSANGSGGHSYPDAMQLFAERASSADSRFELTSENAPAVAEICRRVDGMPLAIELAAARVRLLPPEQIAARLDDSFRLLTGGSRTALPRQQTLRATVDWSYDLLTEEEKAVFSRLAVFREGFTLEAAEAIISGDDVDQVAVFDALASLVDKSMIQNDPGTGRFILLETMRQYSLDRLEEAGETERWRERHAVHYADLADIAYDATRDHRQAEWLRLLEEDQENYRAAITWAVDSERADLAFRIARGLWWFWFSHSHLSAATDTLTWLIESGRIDTSQLAEAYHARAWMKIAIHVEDGLEDAREAVNLARDADDDHLLARTSVALVATLSDTMHADEKEVFEEAYRAAERTGDEWAMTRLALNHGYGLWVRAGGATDPLLEEAAGWFEQSLSHARASGSQLEQAHALSQQAAVLRIKGRREEATTLLDQARDLLELAGDTRRRAQYDLHIAINLIQIGQFTDALTRVDQAKSGFVALGIPLLNPSFIEAAARLGIKDLSGAVAALRYSEVELDTSRRANVEPYCTVLAKLAIAFRDYDDAAKLMGFAGKRKRPPGTLTGMIAEEVIDALDTHLPDWRGVAEDWAERPVTEVTPLVVSVLDRLEAEV